MHALPCLASTNRFLTVNADTYAGETCRRLSPSWAVSYSQSVNQSISQFLRRGYAYARRSPAHIKMSPVSGFSSSNSSTTSVTIIVQDTHTDLRLSIPLSINLVCYWRRSTTRLMRVADHSPEADRIRLKPVIGAIAAGTAAAADIVRLDGVGGMESRLDSH